jgi:PAS domain S-box-containing protein
MEEFPSPPCQPEVDNGTARPLSSAAPNRPAGKASDLFTRLQIQEEVVRGLRQQLEEARSDSQFYRLRYQELFYSAPEAYLETDTHGLIREANQAAAALLQVRREFLVDRPLASFIGEARWSFYTWLNSLLRQPPVPQTWQGVLQAPGLKPVEAVLTTFLVLNNEGQPLGFRWLLRDKNPWKGVEQSLQAERDFKDSLLDMVQAAVAVVDVNGRILSVNSYLAGVSGYTEQRLGNRDWITLLVPEAGRPAAREIFRQALASRVSKTVTLGLLPLNGAEYTFAWSARILDGDPGKLSILLVGHDISDIEKAQRQALQAERLAAIGQMVTGLAHESRNALQRIQGCLQMLRWELQDQPRAQDLIGRALQAQDELHRLYEDVREFAAPLHLDLGPCDLKSIWREAWTRLGPLHSSRQGQFVEKIDGLDPTCSGDERRLRQIFRNVLENALAASTEPVQITVSCFEAQLDGRPALSVEVQDNGPGLTAEQRKRAFEPFYTTKTKGTGLGLSITRRIIEAHGGRIEIGEGPGGKFLITLPRMLSQGGQSS